MSVDQSASVCIPTSVYHCCMWIDITLSRSVFQTWLLLPNLAASKTLTLSDGQSTSATCHRIRPLQGSVMHVSNGRQVFTSRTTRRRRCRLQSGHVYARLDRVFWLRVVRTQLPTYRDAYARCPRADASSLHVIEIFRSDLLGPIQRTLFWINAFT